MSHYYNITLVLQRSETLQECNLPKVWFRKSDFLKTLPHAAQSQVAKGRLLKLKQQNLNIKSLRPESEIYDSDAVVLELNLGQ